MSAIGGKADMVLHCTCLLMTQSGHATIIAMRSRRRYMDDVRGCRLHLQFRLLRALPKTRKIPDMRTHANGLHGKLRLCAFYEEAN
jgi:hypothetical protein